MRGRVGRSNKKAFCKLIAPPLSTLTDEARKRLQALEQFTDLGSGFKIAMKDLEIRGAGDLLGGRTKRLHFRHGLRYISKDSGRSGE